MILVLLMTAPYQGMRLNQAQINSKCHIFYHPTEKGLFQNLQVHHSEDGKWKNSQQLFSGVDLSTTLVQEQSREKHQIHKSVFFVI